MIKLDITAILPYLVKNPIAFSLLIPLLLIYRVPQFANATLSAQILFGVIGESTLIFTVWFIKQWIASGLGR